MDHWVCRPVVRVCYYIEILLNFVDLRLYFYLSKSVKALYLRPPLIGGKHQNMAKLSSELRRAFFVDRQLVARSRVAGNILVQQFHLAQQGLENVHFTGRVEAYLHVKIRTLIHHCHGELNRVVVHV